MKLNFIGILTFMLMAGTTSAQHVNIGIKGGLNGYNVNYNNNTTFDSKVGLHLGLLGHVHLAGDLALQPEIYYSQQGANSSNGSTKTNLDYINIPVLFQYMFDNGFRIQAGPQLGVLLSANNVTNNAKTDVKNNYGTLDLGLSIGASYIHPPSGFGVDARYNHGMNDITENSSVKVTNRGFQFGVFYLFGHRS